MNNALFLAVTVTLATSLICSSFYVSNVFGKPVVTKGPIDCDSAGGLLTLCCQTETTDGVIEIKYCTFCDATHPPSNCGSLFQGTIDKSGSDNPVGPKDSGDLGQLPPPPKSNDSVSPNNDGGVLEQNPSSSLSSSNSDNLG